VLVLVELAFVFVLVVEVIYRLVVSFSGSASGASAPARPARLVPELPFLSFLPPSLV